MKTINMLERYYNQSLMVEKNHPFKIEIPAWYLKDIMGLIHDEMCRKNVGDFEWNPILHRSEQKKTKEYQKWRWIFDFIEEQIRKVHHEKQD